MKQNEFLFFLKKNHIYGVDRKYIFEIFWVKKFYTLPFSRKEIKGIFFKDDYVVPIICLSDGEEIVENSLFVILNFEGFLFSIMVDKVLGFKVVQEFEEVLEETNFIKRVKERNSGVFFLVDIEKLYNFMTFE